MNDARPNRTKGKLKSLSASLNWPQLAVELLVVVVGVFVGMQVTNWNTARSERAETLRTLDQLRPELEALTHEIDILKRYYTISDRYADAAYAGWREDSEIDDERFVVSAYQASRFEGQAINLAVWADIFGAQQVPRIKDDALREALVDMLTIDSGVADWRQLNTEYRNRLRSVLPEDIQAVIAEDCATVPDVGTSLPKPGEEICDTRLSEQAFSEAAAILRDDAELLGLMRQQRSVYDVYVYNMGLMQGVVDRLSNEIARVREN